MCKPSHAFHDRDRCLKCPHTRATHFHDDRGYYCTECEQPHGEDPVPYECVA